MMEDRDNYEAKREREGLRPVISGILAALLVIVIIAVLSGCASVPAEPEKPVRVPVHTFSGPHGVATLYGEPCTDKKVLVHIPEPYRPVFMAGEGTYGGPLFALCWADELEAPGLIFIMWEDGGYGRLSKEVLQGGKGA